MKRQEGSHGYGFRVTRSSSEEKDSLGMESDRSDLVEVREEAYS